MYRQLRVMVNFFFFRSPSRFICTRRVYHFGAQVVREAPGRFTCNANTNKPK
jgi:hypothetical protein